MRVTALVVHVAPSMRELQREALEAADFTVVTASSYAEACERLDEVHPDLVIAPVRLGAYNGIHLAIRVQARSPRTRVLITGDRDDTLELEAARAAAVYLSDTDVTTILQMAQALAPRRGPAPIAGRC